MPDHPKVAGLSDAALAMHIRALCYCARYLTDGLVPVTVLAKLGSEFAAAELERAGLWKKAHEGWQIHDFLEYQESRKKVTRRRAKGKARLERFRKRHKNANVTPLHAVVKRSRNANPGPGPGPYVQEHPLTPADAGRRKPSTRAELKRAKAELDAFRTAHPRMGFQEWRAWREAHPGEPDPVEPTCPHVPNCADDETCVRLLVDGWRERETRRAS